jgi:hypothetical protein
VDRVFEHLVEQRHLVVDGLVIGDVEIEQDEGAPGARPQPGDRASIPGREGRDLRIAPQRPDQRGALFVKSLRRTLEEEHERRRVAEVLVQHPGGAIGVRTGDFDRARIQLFLEAETEHREKRDHDHANEQ